MSIENVVEDPVPSVEPAFHTWNGETWYYNKKARYYYSRDGALLHRCLWIAAHGPIPDGYEVHHVDKNRWNNALSNFQLLTIHDHRSLTVRERTDPAWVEGRGERTSAGLRKMWATREPKQIICVQCDQWFESTGMRAMLCSDDCRKAYYKQKYQNKRDQRRAGL